MQEECLFCKISSKQITANIVYEDENNMAFLDINPTNYGHTLVMPKQHYETFVQTPDEILQKTIIAVKKIAQAILKLPNIDGVNIMVNNGKTAGQVIPHLHFHIIPRLETDELQHWKGEAYKSDEQMIEYAEMIKKELAS